ncbi:hypothetical protein GUJ93_ZPchr0002g24108 [Zizania palustris]|uniref:Uncharacterized protein n=1 Tax=Zizania palustris TaxID=103762 RepID=A0A8J5SJ33_ZIZPA|nr:hypothetical protein GUJ93_ZPchr0002g24108 [Zizania palustris]
MDFSHCAEQQLLLLATAQAVLRGAAVPRSSSRQGLLLVVTFQLAVVHAQRGEFARLSRQLPRARAGGRAARILDGAEQICTPGRLTVAPVVAGTEPGSYELGSRLAASSMCGDNNDLDGIRTLRRDYLSRFLLQITGAQSIDEQFYHSFYQTC